MSLWAIIPVKPLRRGKSRLAGVLSEEERTLLNYSMLANTLKVVTAVKEIDKVLVISRDSGALAMARDFGARTVQEDGKSDDLNQALKRATVVAQISGAQSVLILPADLPKIDAPGIQAMIRKGKRTPFVVIAPDRRHEGTNGLYISPAGLIDYQFGKDSFERHIEQAKRYNINVEVFDHPALALDLDVPEDLELLRHMELMQFHLKESNEPLT